MLPISPLVGLPNPEIELMSPESPALAGAFFVIGPPRKHKFSTYFLNLSKLWEIVEDRGAWCATVHGVAKD